MADRRMSKAKRDTLFPKMGARVNLQPQSMAQNFIEVRNETQLRAALGSLPGAQGNCYGKGISIVAPITLTAPLVLAATLNDGLTITCPGQALLDAAGFSFNFAAQDIVFKNVNVSNADTFTLSSSFFTIENCAFTDFDGFLISGTDGELRNLSLSSGSASAAIAITGSHINVDQIVITDGEDRPPFSSIVSMDDSSYNIFSRIDSNNSTVSVFVDFPGDAAPSDHIWLRDCMVQTATVEQLGQSWIVSGNEVGDITANSSSGSSVYGGNFFPFGGTIDTSAGAGSNTIFGNVNVTVVSHGTDQVGLNT